MSYRVDDYLIEQPMDDWQSAISAWAWLLPPDATIWGISRFADVFLVMADGTVWMLDVGVGSLTRLADDTIHFQGLVEDEDNAVEWLMTPLVDDLVDSGMTLRSGQCYGFKIPPVLGGDYTIENVAMLPISDYLGSTGSIHEQLQELPDGAEVVVSVVDDDAVPNTVSDSGFPAPNLN
jgi:hypothetical protein